MIGYVWGRRLRRVHMQGQGINASVAPNPRCIQGILEVGNTELLRDSMLG